LKEIVNGRQRGWRALPEGWEWDAGLRHWQVLLVGIGVGTKQWEKTYRLFSRRKERMKAKIILTGVGTVGEEL
jgi:hypothetical protein